MKCVLVWSKELLVEKLSNAEDKVECKKLKKELEESRFSNTLLRMQNERVERDFYWTRVRAHEFYQEMIRRGFVIMPPKSAPLTQAAIRRMIKESVDAAIAAEWARQAKAGNDARGSGSIRGQDVAPAVRGCTFTGFMKCNPIAFHGTKGAVELRRWFEKAEYVFGISECVEGKKVVFAAATLPGLALTCRSSSGKSHQKDNSCQPSQNNRKQGNTRAMVTAPTNGRVSSGLLPLCERCFTRHVGACTIKCYKCGKVGHKARYYKEKNAATGVNALPIPTCYDYGEQGHTRNRCPMKIKQEEVRG
ncbi:putative reverse transcriptase domain-containing protein [Tanacetum coccineum]